MRKTQQKSERVFCPGGLFVRREALGHRAARSALAVRPPLLRDELTRLDKATIDEVSMAGACVHCSTATTVLCTCSTKYGWIYM